jgi:hypothetical protein
MKKWKKIIDEFSEQDRNPFYFPPFYKDKIFYAYFIPITIMLILMFIFIR